jgi:methionyl-tRNA formyltransferase
MTQTIRPEDTAGTLLATLAEGGAGLLVATLDGIEDGSLEAREQSEDGLSFAPKILVDDARVDWTHPAAAIDRQVRACTPAPGAWSTFEGERIKIRPVTLTDRPALPPGELEVTKNAVFVGTATAPVELGEVKAFGKKQMPAADWARGVRVGSGARFGADGR